MQRKLDMIVKLAPLEYEIYNILYSSGEFIFGSEIINQGYSPGNLYSALKKLQGLNLVVSKPYQVEETTLLKYSVNNDCPFVPFTGRYPYVPVLVSRREAWVLSTLETQKGISCLEIACKIQKLLSLDEAPVAEIFESLFAIARNRSLFNLLEVHKKGEDTIYTVNPLWVRPLQMYDSPLRARWRKFKNSKL